MKDAINDTLSQVSCFIDKLESLRWTTEVVMPLVNCCRRQCVCKTNYSRNCKSVSGGSHAEYGHPHTLWWDELIESLLYPEVGGVGLYGTNPMPVTYELLGGVSVDNE